MLIKKTWKKKDSRDKMDIEDKEESPGLLEVPVSNTNQTGEMKCKALKKIFFNNLGKENIL